MSYDFLNFAAWSEKTRMQSKGSRNMEAKQKTEKMPVGYTVIGVIETAGGAGKVAAACGVPVQSVAKWRYIPGWHAKQVAILAGLPLAVVRPDMVQHKE